MVNEIQIYDLKKRPEFAPLIAHWIEKEWGKLPIHLFFETVHKNGNWSSNYPLTLVAIQNDELIGTVSLLLDDLETRTEFNPWIGCLYVQEQYRNRGIGKEIMLAIMDRCIKELGLKEVFLFTEDKEKLYESLGYICIDKDTYNGKKISIMKKQIEKLSSKDGISKNDA